MTTQTQRDPDLAERFWSKVNKDGPNGCWVWTASKQPDGYGFFKVDGKTRKAHRVAYELVVGPISDGLMLNPGTGRSAVRSEEVRPLGRQYMPERNREEGTSHA